MLAPVVRQEVLVASVFKVSQAETFVAAVGSGAVVYEVTNHSVSLEEVDVPINTVKKKIGKIKGVAS